MTEAAPEHWRKCNSCKKPIGFKAEYWVCNVSTCTRKRTGFVFCSVSCWDAHLPMMNHRESWAEERTAPTFEEWQAEENAPRAKRVPREESKDEKKAEEAALKAPAAVRTILRRGAGSGSNP